MGYCKVQPATGSRSGDNDQENKLPTDRISAMEDCSRLAREADASLPIVNVMGNALMLLSSTVNNSGTALFQNRDPAPGENLSAEVAAMVSAEASSAVTEAEGLMDSLLRVIQVIDSAHAYNCQHFWLWVFPLSLVMRCLLVHLEEGCAIFFLSTSFRYVFH